MPGEDAAEVVVRFDQHQVLLLDRLLADDEFGDSYEAVIVEAFRAYASSRGLLNGEEAR